MEVPISTNLAILKLGIFLKASLCDKIKIVRIKAVKVNP
jgi:hypothetical protein